MKISPCVFVALSAIALSGCATRPSSIAPVSMGDAFSDVPCANVPAMLETERKRVDTLFRQQRNTVTGDTVGVAIIGVPVSSLSGRDVAQELATSKGKVNALERRAIACGSSF
ncbi:MAG: hypothetical protein AAFO80_00405 [Pseudomonadota bacterium]